MEALETEIKDLIISSMSLEDVRPGDIDSAAPLFNEGLGLDSIDALELVVSMEKTFGVGVPNSEVASKALQTVNSLHDYILEKTERPAA